ncbi:MAG: DAK2 domain-containing protein, partial [Nocardioidaceae bacterium]
DDLHVVVGAAVGAARDALAQTPEQLDVLGRAGVVDAGGRGVVVLLDALQAVVDERPLEPAPRSIAHPHLDAVDVDAGAAQAYEVMYLLDTDDAGIGRLRRSLDEIGDSVVVSGGDGLWNVHVHVDDVGAAVEAGIAAGRPYRVRVTHFVEQLGDRAPTRTGRAVLAVSAGPGLRRLFADAGAQVLPDGGTSLSAAQILAALRGTGAAELVVLPNDRHCTPAAQAAAATLQEESGVRVVVIETTTQVQGLAALAVHEPARPFDRDVLEMTAAARHTRSGAVTVATRRAITMAGRCEPGDVLGVVEGDFAVIGKDLFTVAVDVLERLLGGGGELVTVLSGQDSEALAARCAGHLADRHPTVDVACYHGGQPRYPLLLGVE